MNNNLDNILLIQKIQQPSRFQSNYLELNFNKEYKIFILDDGNDNFIHVLIKSKYFSDIYSISCKNNKEDKGFKYSKRGIQYTTELFFYSMKLNSMGRGTKENTLSLLNCVYKRDYVVSIYDSWNRIYPVINKSTYSRLQSTKKVFW